MSPATQNTNQIPNQCCTDSTENIALWTPRINLHCCLIVHPEVPILAQQVPYLVHSLCLKQKNEKSVPTYCLRREEYITI